MPPMLWEPIEYPLGFEAANSNYVPKSRQFDLSPKSQAVALDWRRVVLKMRWPYHAGDIDVLLDELTGWLPLDLVAIQEHGAGLGTLRMLDVHLQYTGDRRDRERFLKNFKDVIAERAAQSVFAPSS